MFRFAHQELLLAYAAAPLLALFFWYAFRQRRKALEAFGGLDLVLKLSRDVSASARIWKAVLMVAAVLTLVTALAQPQFGTRVETVKREGQDILIALDVSLSMLAEDIPPNRLEKAKHAIGALIERLQGDRVGLIAFAGSAFVQCPLTLDYGAARMFLNSMGPDLIPLPGTAVGEAIGQAIKAFGEDASHERLLILITDGEDHSGETLERAEEAAGKRIAIHTVGIGSPRGAPIPEFDRTGRRSGLKKDQQGQVVMTRLNEEILEQVAETTGGRYFRATPGESELDLIADSIAGMEKRELDTREFTQYEEQFQVFLWLSLALLVTEFLIPERRRTRLSWRGRFQ